VIDIKKSGGTGALLDAFPPKKTDNDNQLWEFVPDPGGSGYYFIKSKLDGDVIDIKKSGGTGALLDAFPMKKTDNDNQLWMVVGGSFP
jgi:Ricin-type beta-trefoil lectin domain-like